LLRRPLTLPLSLSLSLTLLLRLPPPLFSVLWLGLSSMFGLLLSPHPALVFFEKGPRLGIAFTLRASCTPAKERASCKKTSNTLPAQQADYYCAN
jgi:hypothetical protein